MNVKIQELKKEIVFNTETVSELLVVTTRFLFLMGLKRCSVRAGKANGSQGHTVIDAALGP